MQVFLTVLVPIQLCTTSSDFLTTSSFEEREGGRCDKTSHKSSYNRSSLLLLKYDWNWYLSDKPLRVIKSSNNCEYSTFSSTQSEVYFGCMWHALSNIYFDQIERLWAHHAIDNGPMSNFSSYMSLSYTLTLSHSLTHSIHSHFKASNNNNSFSYLKVIMVRRIPRHVRSRKRTNERTDAMHVGCIVTAIFIIYECSPLHNIRYLLCNENNDFPCCVLA